MGDICASMDSRENLAVICSDLRDAGTFLEHPDRRAPAMDLTPGPGARRPGIEAGPHRAGRRPAVAACLLEPLRQGFSRRPLARFHRL